MANPSPTSTPFTDWMDIKAAARRASSFRSQCTYDPTPRGTPYASTSKTPPTESFSFLRRSISATMASDAPASAQRTGDASTASRSAGSGGFPRAFTRPICTTCDSTSIPSSVRNALQRAPAATRAAVSRALARSRTLRTSSKPYFNVPTRSACPGRGRVSRFVGSGSPSAAMSSRYLVSNSTFGIVIATGAPKVRPCRTPARRSKASASNRWRPPRPYP